MNIWDTHYCAYRAVEANRPTSPIRTKSTYKPTPQRKPPPQPCAANIYKVSLYLQCLRDCLHQKSSAFVYQHNFQSNMNQCVQYVWGEELSCWLLYAVAVRKQKIFNRETLAAGIWLLWLFIVIYDMLGFAIWEKAELRFIQTWKENRFESVFWKWEVTQGD